MTQNGRVEPVHFDLWTHVFDIRVLRSISYFIAAQPPGPLVSQTTFMTMSDTPQLLQFINLFFTLCTLSMSIKTRLTMVVQPLNAPSPMLVTESGIVTLSREVQFENAHSPMLVTPFPIFIRTGVVIPNWTIHPYSSLPASLYFPVVPSWSSISVNLSSIHFLT